MNAFLYRMFVAIGRHLDRVNDADAQSVGNDWRTFLNEWDSYAPPYPKAKNFR